MRRAWAAALLGAALFVGCDDGGEASPTADARPDAPPHADAVVSDGGPLGDAATAPPDASPTADAAPPDAAPPEGAKLLGVACPGEGRAVASVIPVDERLFGPDAIGGAGDLLLMNDQAAFVITGVGPQKTYYYYPGVLADAVPLEGCTQTAPERFEEIAFLVGRPDLGDFPRSILRAFRGERAEVIGDGADGGEARVRFTGVDDLQWLVELELVRQAFHAGGRRALSDTMGVEITVDYVLPPDSRVLRMELRVRNLLGEPQRVLTGTMNIFGDTAPTTFFWESGLSFGGFSLRLGLPWIASRSGDGAWALAMADANVAATNISGVDAFLDSNALLNPPRLGAAGAEDDTRLFTYLFAVGDRDVNSAVRHLQAANPRGLRGAPYMLGGLAGVLVDADTGEGVPDAEVVLAMQGRGGDWAPLDAVTTDADGAFEGEIPAVGAPLRLEVRAPGRDAPEPVPLDLAESDAVELRVPAAGALRFVVRDPNGSPIPSKILLFQDGRRVLRFYGALAERTRPVPPGRYDAVVSRGFEWSIVRAPLEVPPHGIGELDVTLERLLDTTGYLSTDAHMHAGPSPDSTVAVAQRIESAAAEGLDVAIQTDHEVVRDWRDGVAATGLGAHINAAVGQEVTATLPEHCNAYPFEPLPADEDARGGPVQWYGLDLGGVFAAMRERGAGVVQLNHPRQGCNYMCLIDYDRLTGEPRLDDPTALGFPPGTPLWSWDFDAVEYINGLTVPFVDPASPADTGMFEDWSSFLNLGHRVTAMGVTDVHGDNLGTPRTWFAAPTDDPADFRPEHLTAAVLGGHAIVSTGAFADVRVGAARPGDDLSAPGGAVRLEVRLEALPEVDVTHFLVFANCDEVAKVATTDPAGVVKFDGAVDLQLADDAYLVVAAFGAEPLPEAFEADFDSARMPRVTTNAIFVDANGDGVFTAPGGKTCTYDLSPPAP